MKIVLALSLALVLVTTACSHKPVTPSSPAAPANVEQNIYADLLTVQSVLSDLSVQEPDYPQIKNSLNVGIAAYNTAEKAFVDYENAKKLNLANPADLVKIAQQVLDLKSSISTLAASIQEVK